MNIIVLYYADSVLYTCSGNLIFKVWFTNLKNLACVDIGLKDVKCNRESGLNVQNLLLNVLFILISLSYL